MTADTTGYTAVKAAMAAVGCACVANDAQSCYDARYPGMRATYEALGMEREGPCGCRCHELWQEWMEEGDEEDR